MPEEGYEDVLRAQNFKLALQEMKLASRHLEEAGEDKLAHELKVLGGRVVSRMYAALPEKLVKDIREE